MIARLVDRLAAKLGYRLVLAGALEQERETKARALQAIEALRDAPAAADDNASAVVRGVSPRPTVDLESRPLFAIGEQAFEPAIVAVRAPPAPRPVHLRVKGSDISTFRQIFLRLDYAIELPRTPQYIVDLGANIGLAAAYFAGRFPGAQIFCVEPDEDNFRMLQTNIQGCDSIRAVHAAVWPEPGVLEIVDKTEDGAPLKSWSIQVRPVQAGAEGRAVRHIPALTIPEIMERAGFPRIDLLKVDVEGAELELFSHNAGAWIDRVDMLVIETHDKFKPGCEAAVEAAVAGRGFARSQSGENTVFVRVADAAR